jgi:hypothetical protein
MKNTAQTEDVAVGRPSKSTRAAAKKTTTAEDFLDKFLDDDGSSSEEQKQLDHSITRDMMGKGPIVGGVELRPLSLAMVMLLHEVGNEIMIGKRVGDMTNPLLAAGEFLFACNAEASLDEMTDLVFNRRSEFKRSVIQFCDSIQPSDSLILDVIGYINDATSTRVTAELPQSFKGGSADDDMGNE